MVNEVYFYNKNVFKSLKNDIIIEDIFTAFFQIQMIWQKLFWKVRKKMLKIFIKKTQNFICFETLE